MLENKKFAFIRNELASHQVVLFMKGTAASPQCGFSASIITIMAKLKVQCRDIDILADPDLRQAIKDFTNWPTIPQLYIKAEFIGGYDIVREMYHSGELLILLKDQQVNNISSQSSP